MNKPNSLIIYKIIIILAILLTNKISYSQPEATVQFIVGYSHPLPDLAGNFGPVYNQWTGNGNPDSNTFFMRGAVNYGIYIKVPVKKKSHVIIIGGIAYNVFNNTVSYNDATGRGDYDLTQSILGISLGAEYNFFSKKSKFNPFIGAEALFNIFGGKLTIDGVQGSAEYTMHATTRFGFQVGGGFDYAFHNNLGLTIGAKYAYANVIGKSYAEDIGSKYHLNDGAYSFNGANYSAKDIMYLQFYGGLSFYFGR